MARGAFLVSVLFMLAAVGSASGQWELQESHTTANLRGIYSVNGLIAWASGADGTVLRTEDGGSRWQKCVVPPGADKLDFRGIHGWDANQAIVMSSGPGDQSRLYKTIDGCSHWTEETTNSEKEGFWDAVNFQNQDFGMPWDKKAGVLIGDPVHGRFDTHVMVPGHGWVVDDSSCVAHDNEAAFAASNSSVFVFGLRRYIIVTGGKGGARALLSPLLADRDSSKGCLDVLLPLANASDSAGAFSVAFSDLKHGIVVGGDYKKPTDSTGTAAWTADGGRHWIAASKPPHGYRSAVVWYAEAKAWISAGSNGSDISHDDGRNWQRLDDGDWNALSLPYVVGPHGRIARLRTDALKQ